MNKLNVSVRAAAVAAILFAASNANAQSASAVAPDNSKSNRVDTSNGAATADMQTNRASDVDLTKKIRESLVADKSLSTYAHNVKIVSIDGSVTLNGVVRSQDEKGAIEMKAMEIAGKGNVTDQLKIAPAN